MNEQVETPPVTPPETPPPAEDTSLIGTPTTETPPSETPPSEAPAAEDATLIGGSKGEEPELPALGEPIEADALNLPEGVTLDDSQTEEFLALVNDAESRADIANSMLEMYAKVSTANATEAATEWNAMQETWRAEIKADKDFGGDKMDESLGQANALVTKYGGSAFANALNLTGMGNNVEFLRFVMAMRADLPKEAIPVTGNPAAGSTSLADRLFSNGGEA